MRPRLPLLAALSIAGLVSLSGCVANGSGNSDSPTIDQAAITVDSSAEACTVSPAQAPAGDVRFSVTNSGDQVTEFYLLGDDKQRVVGEVEDVGPGLSRDLTVQLAAGTYYTSCKPGMTGEGVGTAAFTVTDAG